MASQMRDLQEAAGPFQRLPIRIQQALSRALVADFVIHRKETALGVAVIELVLIDDQDAVVSRRASLDAARRWSSVLAVARHMFENMDDPDLEPEEVIEAVERGLQMRAPSEMGNMRRAAGGG
jgi:hypothetical protein